MKARLSKFDRVTGSLSSTASVDFYVMDKKLRDIRARTAVLTAKDKNAHLNAGFDRKNVPEDCAVRGPRDPDTILNANFEIRNEFIKL